MLQQILFLLFHIKKQFYPKGSHVPPSADLQQSSSSLLKASSAQCLCCSPYERHASVVCWLYLTWLKWQKDSDCFAKHWWYDFIAKLNSVFAFKPPCLLDGSSLLIHRGLLGAADCWWIKEAQTSHNPSQELLVSVEVARKISPFLWRPQLPVWNVYWQTLWANGHDESYKLLDSGLLFWSWTIHPV